MNTDASRIYFPEQITTFREIYLDKLIVEMDRRFNSANCYLNISRDINGLINKVEYFKDLARTLKSIQRDFTRVLGYNNIYFISQITSIYYNEDNTEDSRIVTTITRDTIANKSRILSCNSVFSTTEDISCYVNYL